MTASARITFRKLLLALLSVLVLTTGLALVAPDSTPVAEAHEKTRTETRTRKVTPPCELIVIFNEAVTYCPPPYTETYTVQVPVFHLHLNIKTCWNGAVIAATETCPQKPPPKPTTKQCPDGSTVAATATCPTPRPTTKQCPDGSTVAATATCPTPRPTTKVCPPATMHEHWPFGCHNKDEDHTATVPTTKQCPDGSTVATTATCPPAPEPDCETGDGEHRHADTNTCHGGSHSCPKGQVPTSRDAHGHVSACRLPPCEKGPGEHRHDSTNICHVGNHSCPVSGQHHLRSDNHGHVLGCHPANSPAHDCGDNQHYISRNSHGHVYGCHLVAGTPHDCPKGQQPESRDDHGHVKGCKVPEREDGTVARRLPACPSNYLRSPPDVYVAQNRDGDYLLFSDLDETADQDPYIALNTRRANWNEHPTQDGCYTVQLHRPVTRTEKSKKNSDVPGKVVRGLGSFFKSVGIGISDEFKEILDRQGEAELAKAEAYRNVGPALIEIDRELKPILCWPGSSTAVGGVKTASDIRKAKQKADQVKRLKDATTVAKASFPGLAITGLHETYCRVKRPSSWSEPDPTSTPTATSTPTSEPNPGHPAKKGKQPSEPNPGHPAKRGNQPPPLTLADILQAQKDVQSGKITAAEWREIGRRWDCQRGHTHRC